MPNCHLRLHVLGTRATLALCGALLSIAASAANPKLQTITVTPSAKSVSVGQNQAFVATGSFSDGSKQALGPDISNIAPGQYDTCTVLSSGGVQCWGSNQFGQLGDGT